MNMQPAAKKLKIDHDPFAEEDDWDDDDILRLVNDDVPTNSQMSQVMRVTGAERPANHLTGPVDTFFVQSSSTQNGSNSAKSFLFKKPSTLYNSGNKSLTNGGSSQMAALQASSPAVPDSTGGSSESQASASQAAQPSSYQQAPDLVRKQMALDGEIKWLRSSLKDKEKCISDLRQAMLDENKRQKVLSAEKEKQFMRDVEALRAELQFKDTELKNTAQGLDILRREKEKTVGGKKAKMNLGSDGFPTDVVWSKTFCSRATNTDQLDNQPPLVSDQFGVSVVENVKPSPGNRLLIQGAHPDVRLRRVASCLMEANLVDKLKVSQRVEEAAKIEKLFSIASVSDVSQTSRLIPSLTSILTLKHAYPQPVVESASQILPVVLESCCLGEGDARSGVKQKLLTALLAALRGDSSSLSPAVVISCLTSLRQLFTADSTIAADLSEELRNQLIRLVVGCMNHCESNITTLATSVASTMADAGLPYHLPDMCLVERLCHMCGNSNLHSSGAILLSLSHTIQGFTSRPEHKPCEHATQIGPSLTHRLYSLISQYQGSTSDCEKEDLYSLMAACLHNLRLFSDLDPLFDANCRDIHSELLYCATMLRKGGGWANMIPDALFAIRGFESLDVKDYSKMPP